MNLMHDEPYAVLGCLSHAKLLSVDSHGTLPQDHRLLGWGDVANHYGPENRKPGQWTLVNCILLEGKVLV